MSRRKIPLAVIAIAVLYLAVGVGGFVLHFRSFWQPDGLWIELTEFLAAVCGTFLLLGKNWARWLAVAWMAFHVAISVPGPLLTLIVHAAFFALIAWALFRRESALYFRGAQTS